MRKQPSSSTTTTSNSIIPSNGSSSGGSKTTPCCSKVGIKRGPWTAEEDEVLAKFIKKEGEGRWRTLPKRAGLMRCGKSCRLRWMNYLRPSVKRGHIAPDEEDLILRLHRLLGNRYLSKKLISQGIDPRTHKPFNQVDHHDSQYNMTNKASSSSYSKTNPHHLSWNPTPNNQTPLSTVPEDEEEEDEAPTEAAAVIQTNKENSYFDLGQYNQSNGKFGNNNFHGYENFTGYSDGSGAGLRSTTNNHVMGSDQLEDNEDINYCSDDVFSSFLNSLINEDAFAGPQHQLLSNGINPPFPTIITDHDHHAPFLSVNNTSSKGWESATMSSAINQNNPPRVDDPVE